MASKPKSHGKRRLGFISDVHGNLTALKAVLEEFAARDVQEIYVAGDLLYGGDQPMAVWKLLQKVGARCVRGTSDTALATVDPGVLKPASAEETRRAQLFADTRASLGELVLRRLGRLPEQLRVHLEDGREVVVVHGSPADAYVPIGHELDDEEVRELLGSDPPDIVICGGTHVSFEREVDGVRIINVGSVGESPAGSRASCTIISSRSDETLVDSCWVEY